MLIIFNGSRLFIAFQEKNEIKENTISYLSEKGYDTEKDIEELSIVNIGEDEVIYSTVVTFIDEPMVDYFYSYNKNNQEITQIDIVNRGTNQSLEHQESS